MRAAIYARVSSAAQRDARTIESQLRACRELAARAGWVVVGEYIDDGVSASAGNLERRAGLLRLLADAEAGAFDVVVTYDDDRLTRSDRLRERGYILGSLQESRIKIAAVTKGSIIDMDTDEGDMTVSLGGLQSSSWLRKHKARVKAGKARAIAEGRKPAGPTPWGLAYDRAAGRWSPHPVNAPIVVEMFERVAGHESCEAIAADLEARGIARPRGGLWARERVYAIVRSRTYVGEWTADRRQRLVVPVPALVTEDLWQRAQAALVSHGRRGLRRVKHIYLLEGLAVCGACGGRIGIRSETRGRRGGIHRAAYVCCRRRRPLRGEPPCTAPVVPVAEVDARLWDAVQRELLDPELLDHMIELERRRAGEFRDWSADAKAAGDRLQRLERAESGVLRRYRDGLVSEAALDTELRELRRHREMTKQQLATAQVALSNSAARGARLEGLRLSMDVLRARVARATAAERQELVHAVAVPGGAVLREGRVRLKMLIEVAAGAGAAASRGGPGDASVGQADAAG